jgi:hypothetical protein
MVDNRRRSDTSGLDTVSVGNPHRNVAQLLLLYTAASATARFDASTGMDIEKSLLPSSELSRPTNRKPPLL